MKILVLYAYHESEGARKNLDFFNRYGLYRTSDVTYFLMVNGSRCSVRLSQRWSGVEFRENTGLDFGAWYHSLQRFDLNQYDYFIFINDTVKGPFKNKDWIRSFISLINDQNKLAGITINCVPGGFAAPYGRRTAPHVQSMLLCTDKIGLSILYPQVISPQMMDKSDTILYKEIGASMAILRAGYNITCILAPYQVDYRIESNCYVNVNNGYGGHPWGDRGYFGRSLYPLETIFFKTNTGTNPLSLRQAIEAQERHPWY